MGPDEGQAGSPMKKNDAKKNVSRVAFKRQSWDEKLLKELGGLPGRWL